MALAGSFLVLLSTNRHGAMLSPDSVGYLGMARNMAAGAGFLSYNGTPVTVQPPLYPALLALVGKMGGVDPFSFAHLLNAALFGLIVYLGGLLTLRHLSSFPAFALTGTLATTFSYPLLQVSVCAWSEPLFIFFMLLGFLFAQSYMEKRDAASLLLFAVSVALASLTRYIGITLMVWGMFVVLVSNRDRPSKGAAHLLLYVLVAAGPLGWWLFRNYSTSGTVFGPRPSAVYTLSQCLNAAFGTLANWYVPSGITGPLPPSYGHYAVYVIGAAACIGAGLFLRRAGWRNAVAKARTISPMASFVAGYAAFLVLTSTMATYDRINDRLLSPIYVPLTLLLLVMVGTLAHSIGKRFSRKSVNSFLLAAFAVWLTHPVTLTLARATELVCKGGGYSGKAWRESGTVQYLLQPETAETERAVYTNNMEAAYILAHLPTRMSPARPMDADQDHPNLSKLKGRWPYEGSARLVWFDEGSRTNLLAFRDLQAVAKVELVARLNDGGVYSVSRK